MSTTGTDRKKLLQIMDSASKIKVYRELARKTLNGEERGYLTDVIASMASGVGQDVSKEDIDAAVTEYLEGADVFVEPPHNLQYKLAEAYVNRGKIGKKYGVPALVITCTGLLTLGGIRVVSNIAENVRTANLEHTRSSLESLITSIRSENPPQVMIQEAESAYKNGMLGIGSKNIEEGKKSAQELASIKNQVHEFSILPKELEKAYKGIIIIAKEPDAKAIANSLYEQGRNFVKVVQIAPLRKTVGEMQDLENILGQQYTMTIVSKSGVKSGIDRYYTDSSGKRISGFYLIVEAINHEGRAIPQRIKSEEDGERETVSMWGERVPQEVYEQVKADKLDNGIIENNVFGEKAKGYLNPKITFKYKGVPLERTGQILRW